MGTIQRNVFQLKLKRVKVWQRQILECLENQYTAILFFRSCMLNNKYKWRPVQRGENEKIRTLHVSLRMVLDDLVSIYRAGFHTGSESNMKLNCFPFLALFCCSISKGKAFSAIRHGLSLKRPCVRCLSKTEGIRQQRCMSSTTMAGSCQARTRTEESVSYLARSSSNIMI